MHSCFFSMQGFCQILFPSHVAGIIKWTPTSLPYSQYQYCEIASLLYIMSFILSLSSLSLFLSLSLLYLSGNTFTSHFIRNTCTPAHSCNYPVSQCIKSHRYSSRPSANIHIKYHNAEKCDLGSCGMVAGAKLTVSETRASPYPAVSRFYIDW